ncbi:hypothetical protein HU200_016800 [Digitaria exilis]|uniref:Uncharacterized protein n=1 Tax=Digitaria exilis TaxID=1010633 RepID=A0A835F7V1_9POAL|nr:hypothetical protein HU200_016800 [Digitaria exilis]
MYTSREQALVGGTDRSRWAPAGGCRVLALHRLARTAGEVGAGADSAMAAGSGGPGDHAERVGDSHDPVWPSPTAARCSSASLLTDPTPPGHAFIVRRRLQPSTPLGRVAVVACTRLRLLHLSASRHDLDVSPPSRLRLEVEPPLRLFALAPRGAALACATNRACLLCALPLPHVRAPATRLPYISLLALPRTEEEPAASKQAIHQAGGGAARDSLVLRPPRHHRDATSATPRPDNGPRRSEGLVDDAGGPLPHCAMSRRAMSSTASRSSTLRAQELSSVVGKETGFPLIQCTSCGLARVVELRAWTEGNHVVHDRKVV